MDVRVLQTGVGRDAVVEATRSEARAISETAGAATLILAGVCGGLRPCPDVPRIARVIDERGREWRTQAPDGVTLIGVDRVISSPRDKRELAERTGAAIVDMESHAFIAECERLGARWHVIRGVSDTPEETLPGEVLGWIDAAGNTRYGRAAGDLIRRPRLIRPIASVLRRSARVLPLVGEEVARVVMEVQRG